MISCENLFQIFQKNGLTFFTGVPDSTFKDWMSFLADEHCKRLTNIIQASECEATATAAGHYLATGKLGVVYMQNSGLGKCVNPLTSLCDKEVYSIPLMLMIGWRGEPGKHDEPQHKKMGRIMLPLLDVLEIPYKILPDNAEEAEKIISEMKNLAETEKTPVAIIIKSEIIEKYSSAYKQEDLSEMTREDAIKIIVDSLGADDIIISTTGKTSRELFEYRVARGEKPKDFYTVGSMGCSSSIAHAIAFSSNKKVFIFDGDGAALMQMGAMATIGHYPVKNLYHIILDNQSYDSTGGQPTVSKTVNFEKIALSCGYNAAMTAKTEYDLREILKIINKVPCPYLLVVKVKPGSRKDLGRPTSTPQENKNIFMDSLKK